jgi:Putative zinc-finger
LNHEQAVQILPDYVEGVVDAGDAGVLERHLASCAECRESVSMLRRISTELTAMGAAAFDDHPESSRLVDYSLVPSHLAAADLERIKVHVKSCPTCALEVAAVRSGDSWSRSWSRGIAEAWRAGIAAVPVPVPTLATAAVALLLVYPAYLGTVKLPAMYRQQEATVAALAHLTAELGTRVQTGEQVPASTGGPSAVLALAGPTRSASGIDSPASDTPPVPVVQLRDHQPFLPVRINFDISAWAAEQAVVVTLRDLNSPQQLWRHSGRAAEFWDPDDEAINLLLPAEALDAGTYTLEIAKEGSPAAAYSADFAIEE